LGRRRSTEAVEKRLLDLTVVAHTPRRPIATSGAGQSPSSMLSAATDGEVAATSHTHSRKPVLECCAMRQRVRLAALFAICACRETSSPAPPPSAAEGRACKVSQPFTLPASPKDASFDGQAALAWVDAIVNL